jgi:hypothetical protein
VFAQQYKVSGTVTDMKTGEPIIGAAVFELNTVTTGTSTNVEGHYKLIFEKKTIWLKAAYIGYADTVAQIVLTGDSVVNFFLRSNTEIAEVEVEDDEEKWKPEDKGIAGKGKPIWAFLTEPYEYVKQKYIGLSGSMFPSYTEIPGSFRSIYTTNGTGYFGHSVYLDGARIYAPNPVFNFLPFAEDETIGKLNYYWGNYPARFNAQTNSVIDIAVKEGSLKKFKGKLYADFLHAGISAEGPVIWDKSSFFIAARKSYFNHPLKDVFLKDQPEFGKYSAEPVFFDLNFKYAHQLTENDKLSYSFYVGRNTLKINNSESHTDSIEYSYEKDLKETVTNTAMTLNYRHVFTTDLMWDASLVFSRYNLNQSIMGDSMGLLNGDYSFINRYDADYISGNEDYGFKTNILWNLNSDHHLNLGGSIYNKRFRPIDAELLIYDFEQPYDLDTTYSADKINVQEYGVYAEDRFLLNDRFTGNVGLHFTAFASGGSMFYSVEPRLYAEYLLFKGLTLRASYNYYKQYMHMLSNHAIGMNSYVYVPAGADLLPVNTHRVTAGTELHLPFEIFINADAFYERSANVREYKDGFGFFDYPETRVLPGNDLVDRTVSGSSSVYGLRVVLNKQYRKFRFNAGHTITNADYQFDTLNFGESFQYAHVNRHDFNLKVSYEVSEDFKIYAEWMYVAGNFITPRKQSYIPYDYRNGLFGSDTSSVTVLSPEGDILYNVGNRNEYQLPTYHRFDIGAEYQYDNHTFGIKIYNLYNRRNTDYSDFSEGLFSRSNTLQLSGYTSLPFFPTLSYSYRFGE